MQRHNQFTTHGVIPRKTARKYGEVYGKFATADAAAEYLRGRGYAMSTYPATIAHSNFIWLTNNEKMATSAAIVAPHDLKNPTYGVAYCL